jgi:hypothetical protein
MNTIFVLIGKYYENTHQNLTSLHHGFTDDQWNRVCPIVTWQGGTGSFTDANWDVDGTRI